MTDNPNQEIKQVLEEIRTGQQVLLNTTRKHLELYAQQLSNTDRMNKQLVELQQKTFQVQKITMGFTIFVAVGVCVFLFMKLL